MERVNVSLPGPAPLPNMVPLSWLGLIHMAVPLRGRVAVIGRSVIAAISSCNSIVPQRIGRIEQMIIAIRHDEAVRVQTAKILECASLSLAIGRCDVSELYIHNYQREKITVTMSFSLTLLDPRTLILWAFSCSSYL